MAKIRYSADIPATGRFMRSQAMQDVVRGAAEKGEAFARSIAPERTGDYKASFSVSVRSDGGLRGDRAEARIVNSSPHATYVEWRDGHHVLARTADFLGGG
jgi:hypothetical protein